MNKPFSIYLDLVRFAAACLVYIYHSNQRWLVHDILPVSNYGHSSVIVFFVLSGFVIAYITDTREKRLTAYAASRLSRVYSVALPAVILTVVLDAVGRKLSPDLYGYPFDNVLLRCAASLLMLNELWFVSITSFSNVPYWSICYEMWYYIGFGLIMFLPKRTGLIALAMLAFALGPKVLLLAPIWLLGVLLYRWQRLQSLSDSIAWRFLAGSIVGIVAFHQANVTEQVASYFKNLLGEQWQAQLTFSKFFISDYLLGIMVFLNFAGMRKICTRLEPLLLTLERPIRFLASYTLSLYLLHQPLFLFWGAVIHGDPSGYANWWLTTGMVSASIVAIGYVTEKRRHLFKIWIEQHLQNIESLLNQRYVISR